MHDGALSWRQQSTGPGPLGLRARAKRLRGFSYFLLILMLIAMSAGIGLFIFAGLFSDISTIGYTRQMTVAFQGIQTHLEALGDEFSRFRQATEQFQHVIESIDGSPPEKPSIFDRIIDATADANKAYVDLLEKTSDSLAQHPNVTDSVDNLIKSTNKLTNELSSLVLVAQTNYKQLFGNGNKVAAEYIAQLNKGLNELNGPENLLVLISENLDEIGKNLASISQSNQSGRQFTYQYVVRESVIRIGAIAILLFLVQILSNLYRYNMRLATFLDSRADVLELLGGSNMVDNATFDQLVQTMSPQVDFGRIDAPYSHIASIFRSSSADKCSPG